MLEENRQVRRSETLRKDGSIGSASVFRDSLLLHDFQEKWSLSWSRLHSERSEEKILIDRESCQ